MWDFNHTFNCTSIEGNIRITHPTYKEKSSVHGAQMVRAFTVTCE